jgi:hypothetical protein
LLNYCGLNLDRVPWVLDASPHKQDKYVPGTRQPVLSPRHLQSTWVDAVLLLAWNLRDELVADQRTYLDRGGCFIIPFPRLQTLRGKVAA